MRGVTVTGWCARWREIEVEIALEAVDHRAAVHALVERGADAHLAEPPLELGDERFRDVLLHEEARARAAHLPLIEPDRRDDRLHRRVEVGRVEDDGRRLAAELERELDAAPRRLAAEELADARRARERHLVDARVGAEVTARLGAAGDDVDDARRHARLGEDLAEEERGERGVRRRLEHDGVPHRERRRDLPREHEQREVPRDDLADDADGRKPRHLLVEELRPAGVVVEVADHEGEVGVARLADRLAVVHRLEHGEQAVVLVDAARHRVQVARAHVAGRRAPRRVRGARRGDRLVDVGVLADERRRQRLPRARVDRGVGFATLRLHERAVDEVAERAAVRLDPRLRAVRRLRRRAVRHRREDLGDLALAHRVGAQVRRRRDA